MNYTRFYLAIIFLSFIFASCSKSDDINPGNPVVPIPDTTSLPVQAPLNENFESGVKADYNSASISLSFGKWNFHDAVIGTLPGDKKNGAKSARLQQSGKLTMNFDIVNAVYRVVVSSASFESDPSSAWELWASYNGGNVYSKIGNSIITTSVLKNDTIIVNATNRVRFSLRKVSGGSSRINIDDIQILLTSGPLPPTSADDDNMLMGNPSNATPSILDESNYYMNKGYYSLSYNRELGKSNWVSWHLQASDLGTTPRQDDFREDVSLPSSWYYVTDGSYTGTGFDRGHYCPSSDRTSSIAANSSTFLMTNIFPQAPNNNQITWERLEDSCRQLVNQGKELFIIMGSHESGGTGNNGFATDIDGGKVTVPSVIWKVVVVLPNGSNDLSRINAATRVIAVMCPNENSVNSNWKTYRVAVDAIESITGHNLLSNLSSSLQLTLEAQVDNL